jgi:hypothetical protein
MLAGDCTLYQSVLVFLFSDLIHQGCLLGDRVVTSSSPQSAIYRCHLQEFLEGLSEEVVLGGYACLATVGEQAYVSPFVKDKQGELTMTPCLAALIKRVAERRA